MNLLDSLLDAIVRLDGDALIMHVGEKPYVVTTSESQSAYRGPLSWGQVELSSKVLTPDAVSGMLMQLLPAEHRQALDDLGATEFSVAAPHGQDELFTIVAARGGDDVWLEVQRKRRVEPPVAAVTESIAPVPESAAPIADETPTAAAEPPPAAIPEIPVGELPIEEDIPLASLGDTIADEPLLIVGEEEEQHAAESSDGDDQVFEISLEGLAAETDFVQPSAEALSRDTVSRLDGPTIEEEEAEYEEIALEFDHPARGAEPVISESTLERAPAPVADLADSDPDSVIVIEAVSFPVAPIPPAPPSSEPAVEAGAASTLALAAPRGSEPGIEGVPGVSFVSESAFEVVGEEIPAAFAADAKPARAVTGADRADPGLAVREPPRSTAAIAEDDWALAAAIPPEALAPDAPALTSEPAPVASDAAEDAQRPAVILPLARSPVRPEVQPEVRPPAGGSPLERILRIAAARGAATVYVVAQSQPMIRVDGEISVLDREPAMTASEVERLVMDLAPARARDAAQHGGEWMADVADVGRVRCVTFRDHRGPGVVFRMIPPKAISADQLGLSAEVQALGAQPDGLVLVVGSRASGKSTLLTAFVDLINRTRSDHVITIEPQIGFVHESRRSFVSQREVRGDSDAAAATVRSAFREDPDVLVIEDLRTPDVVALALEAAESGRLVFGSMAAPATAAAIERLLEMTPADRRRQVQTSLAGALRGVVAQVLLRKTRGGRVAAREVLLNTPAVASLILDGKTFQLPVALESGRRHGMVPFAESLAAFVRQGTVQAAEAYRKAQDREALLAVLKRDGIDTGFAERLA